MHRVKELLVIVFIKSLRLDSQLLQKADRSFAVIAGSLDRLGSTISNQRLLSCLEFISLGVAAKIVVVVEEQNLRLLSGKFAVEVRGRQTTDARADDDQIV